jgi:hypothetical protein
MDIEGVAGVGIPSRGLTSGADKSPDEYYQYMLAELKAHKDAKTWLLTTSAREQQRANNLILGNINSVVASKCFYFIFQLQLCIYAFIIDTNFFFFPH